MWKDQDITCCHLAFKSDSQLFIDLYRGGVILSPGTGTAKNNMSNDQEVAQPKPNPDLKAHIMNNLICYMTGENPVS